MSWLGENVELVPEPWHLSVEIVEGASLGLEIVIGRR
jgi:hypothetical protein